MNLTHVRYFVTICQTGSITKAAAKLNVSQPGLSAAVRELEREFSLKLFIRNGRSIKLTEAGEKFCALAVSLLEKADSTSQIMMDYGTGRGFLRLGITPMLALLMLPKLYHTYSSEYPGINLTVEENGRHALLSMLDTHELDMLITSFHPKPDDNYEFKKIFSLELGFCTYAGHPCADQSRVSISDIGSSPLGAFTMSYQQNEAISQMFALENITPNIVFRSSQLSTLMEMTRRAECSCFLYTALQSHYPDLRFLPLIPEKKVPIYLCWRKDDYMFSDMKNFAKTVRMIDFP